MHLCGEEPSLYKYMLLPIIRKWNDKITAGIGTNPSLDAKPILKLSRATRVLTGHFFHFQRNIIWSTSSIKDNFHFLYCTKKIWGLESAKPCDTCNKSQTHGQYYAFFKKTEEPNVNQSELKSLTLSNISLILNLRMWACYILHRKICNNDLQLIINFRVQILFFIHMHEFFRQATEQATLLNWEPKIKGNIFLDNQK